MKKIGQENSFDRVAKKIVKHEKQNVKNLVVTEYEIYTAGLLKLILI